MWSKANGATGYDVYFGTTQSPSYFTATTDNFIYPPVVLQENTTYYWQIEAYNASGYTSGGLWMFRTQYVGAKTIYISDVDGDDLWGGTSWGDALKSIGRGIFDAQDGDMLLLADGTYSGANNTNLDFGGKQILIRSDNGYTNCIIDCQGAGRAFTLQSGEDIISGLDGIKIVNGYVADGNGGAVYIANSSPYIQGCVFEYCTVEQVAAPEFCVGGAIAVQFNAYPWIEGCGFYNNHADIGGAVACGYNANAGLYFSRMDYNTADIAGGGFSAAFSSPFIVDCFFNYNSAPSGGNVRLFSCPGVKVFRCFIDYSQDGGGILMTGCDTVWLSDCEIAWNFASSGGGGIHYVNGSTGGILTGCTIAYNETDGSGGGVYCSADSDFITENCIIWANLSIPGVGHQLYGEPGGAAIALNLTCFGFGPFDVSVDSLWSDAGCINDNPEFYDFASGDISLASWSPCIDAGSDGYANSGYDIMLNPRNVDGDGIWGESPDMGCYEYQP